MAADLPVRDLRSRAAQGGRGGPGVSHVLRRVSGDSCCARPVLSRRTLLRAAMLVPAAAALPAAALPAHAAAPLRIRPRADWAQGLAPTGPLVPETDVRFLLVHHTASTNSYAPADVAPQLRDFFRFHTGPEKRWSDIAYNFLVDRFGGVWEGRAGSLAGPVQASATGGSQGFAQLACFIGDHRTVPPTPAARASMLRVLAWLADRDGVDTRPGATVQFVSRGSNRWPEGREVTAATLSAHRDMSQTTCPGETVYADVRERYPAEVTALRVAARPAAPPPTPSEAPPVAAAPPAAPSAAAAPTVPAATATPSAASAAPASAPDGHVDLPVALVGAGAVLATTAAVVAARHTRSEPRP